MINYCNHCEEETNDTIEICIDCVEVLLSAVNEVTRLKKNITNLEYQLGQQLPEKAIYSPIPANLVRTLEDREITMKKMLDIGKRVQDYKGPNIKANKE